MDSNHETSINKNIKIKDAPFFTLLLITNSPVIHSFFEKMIEHLERYALICVHSQIEAQDYLKKTYISCIIVDENTPQIKLTSFCETIRSLDDHPYTPILIITGHLKKSFTRNLLKAGATDFLREPLEEDEVFLRIEIANTTLNTQQKMAKLSPHFVAHSSTVTNLNTRAIIDDRATKIINTAMVNNTSLVLFLIEIDQYQEYKKILGQHAAQHLLIDFTDHLRKLIRIQDSLFDQRHGKFAVFLPKTSKKASQLIAENIQEYLETESFSAGNLSFCLTISVGLATLASCGKPTKSPGINLERLLAKATHCLNEAKKKGNSVVCD